MRLTPEQQDALIEIANLGAGKAARHLSVLLRDTVQMSVPEIAVGAYHELGALLDLDPGDTLVGVQQRAKGLLDAQVSLLFHSQESQELARELVGTGLPVVGVDTRELEHDAMVEIGNIVVSACIRAFTDLLGGSIRLSLPSYAEGCLDDILRLGLEERLEGEWQVLLMKTHLRLVRREVEGAMVVVLSPADLATLTRRIDHWLSGLQTR